MTTELTLLDGAGPPPHELDLRHLNVHHDEGRTPLHDVVERLGLRHGPREAVQDEPAGHVGSREPFVHDLDQDVVAHEPAGFHDPLGAQADREAEA